MDRIRKSGSQPAFDLFFVRTALATLLLSAICLPQLYQPLLTTVYDYLETTAIYRASTFETFWTVFCYAAIEPWVTVIYLRHPEWRLAFKDHQQGDPATAQKPAPRPRDMRRPSRRLSEALTYMAPLLLLDLTMIKKFANVDLDAMLLSGNYDPSALPTTSYHGTNFLAPSLHNFSLSSPLQTQRALPLDAPSSRRLALELMASFVIYDACFFAFHLSLHAVPPLRRWHAPHHRHGEMHPQITNRLAVAERLGLVMLANFALNVVGSHVLTRTLFVPLFVWLLVEIHCGLDLPWGYEKILPRGWAGGARKHALHHGTGEGNIEPFFNWCDGAWEYLWCLRARPTGQGEKPALHVALPRT